MTLFFLKNMRLDIFLVKNGFVKSRERAKSLIINGGVLVDGEIIKKSNKNIEDNAQIKLLKPDIKWVSRAGLKLEHAFLNWDINIKNNICADFGACTGGFTEVLLEYGAARVYAIDVGSGQLAEKIKNDKRVINMENTHIKNITKENFEENISFVCIDVSFISLSHILPKASEIISENGEIIALIKPQFEVGKKLIKKGVVTDSLLHAKTIEKIKKLADKLNLEVLEIANSPILGSKGNQEFLIYLKKKRG